MINIVDNIDSTNTWLTEFNNDFFDSIISLQQSKGYGRQGRFWESELGGLYYSVVLPYKKTLPIIIGVSASDILAKHNIDIRIKWPNDLLVDGKKLGGILCQSQGENAIIGLGINVNNNPNLSESINLSDLGCNIDKLNFIDSLSKRMAVIMKWKEKKIIDKFLTYDCLIGTHVSWSDGKGRVEHISEEGHLAIRNANNELFFLTEEVHLE